jgi:hypothetical protein
MTSDSKDKKIHKIDWLGNIGCTALLLLVIAWGVVIYNGVHRSINRGTITLKAEITINENILSLNNKNNFDWRYVYFSLDTDNNPENYEYSYYLTTIQGKETVSIDLTKFKKADNQTYDPLTVQPKHLSFFAQTSQGTGHYIYTWPGY